MDLKETIATELEVVRRRSLDLLDPLPEQVQVRQHSPLMSPVVWDLAHVGNYEEIWLLRDLGFTGVGPQYDGVYDAFLTPRAERLKLPMLGPLEARAYIGEVRGRVMDSLDRVDLDPANPRLRDGFLYGMVVQHEHQHDETILAALQLLDGEGYSRFSGDPPAPPPSTVVAAADVLVPGGPFVMGTDTESWAYDNERSAHVVDVAPFFMDTTPVTNAAYLAFIEDGGYDDPRWWTAEGWKWRQREDLRAPQFWSEKPGDSVTRFGRTVPWRADEPVQHVCWYEADAYARWAGKRLPTEAEWEKAASWDPANGRTCRYPWGDDAPAGSRANIGQALFGPAPIGAYPSGVSSIGCHQMIGDVWEWTSSDFQPYPGFDAFPYREYSEVFYGTRFKVLRGGSWATHEQAIRNTFRNWDFPIRRQIFAGFRCARSA